MRWGGRHLLWAAPVMLLVFVLASDLAGWFYLRQPLAGLLSARLERRVELGKPFSIHLRRSILIRAGSLVIAAPDWSREPHFIAADGLEADLDWGVLVGRRPTLHRLAVGRADVRAERNAEGLASWSLGSGNSLPEDEGSRLAMAANVVVGDAQILLKDAQQGLSMQLAARTVEKLRDGNDEKLRASSDRAQGTRLSVTGEGHWKDAPVSFKLEADGARVPLAPGDAPAEVEVEARLRESVFNFKGSVSDLAHFRKLSGRLSATGKSLGELASIPGLALPSTPPYRFEAELVRDGSLIKVDVTRAEIGASNLKAKLDYDVGPATPMLRGTVDASRLVLQDLGPTIGAGGGSKVLPGRQLDFHLLRAMNADVVVDLNRIDLGTNVLQPMQSLKARLQLEGGVLKVQDLTSTLADGRVTGSILLDASAREQAPEFQADLRWKSVDLRKWLKGAGDGYIVAGRFHGETQLKGRGNSTAAILQVLEGKVKGQVQGGSVSHQLVELAGLDVAEALGLSVTGDKPLQLTCALLDLTARKGTLRSDLFLLNTVDTLFFVQGNLDLGTERLNLRLVQAPKDWSPLSLRSPVTISGTLGEPVVGVEVAPAALKLLASAVLAAVAPVAALLPLIDPGETSAKGGCGAAIAKVREKAAELGPVPGKPGATAVKPEGDPPRDRDGTLRKPGRVTGEGP